MSNLQFTLAAFSDEAADDLTGQISALRRNGLSHMELRSVNGKGCADLTVHEAKEIRRICDDNGIFIKTLGTPAGKIKISDAFSPELEKFLHLTELAGVFGAEKMRIFSFYRDSDWEESAGRAEALERLNSFSRRAGSLILCHENEKGIYGDGWEFCKEISTQIPQIKAVFDPANYVQCGVDTTEAWKEMKDFVSYLHLKDSLPDGRVVPCGEGWGHVPEILSDYRQRGGNFATLEPHLALFSAKKSLEKEAEETCQYRYENQTVAFDAAVAAVNRIITEQGGVIQ